MQPSGSSSIRSEGNDHDNGEMTVPFDGTHLLECFGMTQYVTVLSLEEFLHQQQWSSVAPVVRYAAVHCCYQTHITTY